MTTRHEIGFLWGGYPCIQGGPAGCTYVYWGPACALRDALSAPQVGQNRPSGGILVPQDPQYSS
jgi:hypothetical protein